MMSDADSEGYGSDASVAYKGSHGSASADAASDNEPDSCVFCLEAAEPESRGLIAVCEHLFHFSCISAWAKISNTCPMCKRRFLTIERKRWSEALGWGELLERQDVARKDQQVQRSAEELEELEALEDVVCSVCGSGEDEGLLLLCDGECDTATHTYCLGLTEIPAGQWFCEVCGTNGGEGGRGGVGEVSEGEGERTGTRGRDEDAGRPRARLRRQLRRARASQTSREAAGVETAEASRLPRRRPIPVIMDAARRRAPLISSARRVLSAPLKRRRGLSSPGRKRRRGEGAATDTDSLNLQRAQRLLDSQGPLSYSRLFSQGSSSSFGKENTRGGVGVAPSMGHYSDATHEIVRLEEGTASMWDDMRRAWEEAGAHPSRRPAQPMKAESRASSARGKESAPLTKGQEVSLKTSSSGSADRGARGRLDHDRTLRELLETMRRAAQEDALAESRGWPSTAKLSALPAMTRKFAALSRSDYGRLRDLGLLDIIRQYVDRSANETVITEALRILVSCPVEQRDLRENRGLSKSIVRISAYGHYLESTRELARTLLQSWFGHMSESRLTDGTPRAPPHHTGAHDARSQTNAVSKSSEQRSGGATAEVHLRSRAPLENGQRYSNRNRYGDRNNGRDGDSDKDGDRSSDRHGYAERNVRTDRDRFVGGLCRNSIQRSGGSTKECCVAATKCRERGSGQYTTGGRSIDRDSVGIPRLSEGRGIFDSAGHRGDECRHYAEASSYADKQLSAVPRFEAGEHMRFSTHQRVSGGHVDSGAPPKQKAAHGGVAVSGESSELEREFKEAVARVVKEELYPVYRQGKMGRDTFKKIASTATREFVHEMAHRDLADLLLPPSTPKPTESNDRNDRVRRGAPTLKHAHHRDRIKQIVARNMTSLPSLQKQSTTQPRRRR